MRKKGQREKTLIRIVYLHWFYKVAQNLPFGRHIDWKYSLHAHSLNLYPQNMLMLYLFSHLLLPSTPTTSLRFCFR